MRTVARLVAGGLAIAAIASPLALAGEPAPLIVAARYSIQATGSASLTGAGNLEVATTTLIPLRAAVSGATVVADALSWKLQVVNERTTLVLNFRVRITSDAGVCPKGARGTVTAVDDDSRLANGRTKDSVRVRFNAGKCPKYVRAWTNAGAERRARVEIRVEFAP